MATHSSILAWEIPWTEEPGGANILSPQDSIPRERNSTEGPQIAEAKSPLQ